MDNMSKDSPAKKEPETSPAAALPMDGSGLTPDELAELDPDFAAESAPDRNEALALRTRLQENAESSPELYAGDVDAAWDRADSGEETVGGSSPTPDQDRVDELGAAVGVTYGDAEPLHDKVAERDQKRWELDPRSAEDAV